ncbi:hypothetical protein D918_05277 [Trichuris suis]|nr:hypothetical protein D918_05277 [Trichuris suis]
MTRVINVFSEVFQFCKNVCIVEKKESSDGKIN